MCRKAIIQSINQPPPLASHCRNHGLFTSAWTDTMPDTIGLLVRWTHFMRLRHEDVSQLVLLCKIDQRFIYGAKKSVRYHRRKPSMRRTRHVCFLVTGRGISTTALYVHYRDRAYPIRWCGQRIWQRSCRIRNFQDFTLDRSLEWQSNTF